MRSEDSTSSAARGSRLTNRISPSGISGSPISSAAARARAVEGEERVVRLGGGQQLAAAHLDGAELAAHQRLAAERAAGGELDDRLEVRAHQPVREELGEPVGARAVEQRLGRQRQRLLVGEPDGEQAGALGLRERAAAASLRRSSQPGPASSRPSTAMSPSAGSVARCSTL